jgi:hypothetical protein
MEAAVREFRLGLDADRPCDTPAIETSGHVAEQGTLADAGLAAEHEDSTATVERVRERCIEKLALGMSSQ